MTRDATCACPVVLLKVPSSTYHTSGWGLDKRNTEDVTLDNTLQFCVAGAQVLQTARGSARGATRLHAPQNPPHYVAAGTPCTWAESNPRQPTMPLSSTCPKAGSVTLGRTRDCHPREVGCGSGGGARGDAWEHGVPVAFLHTKPCKHARLRRVVRATRVVPFALDPQQPSCTCTVQLAGGSRADAMRAKATQRAAHCTVPVSHAGCCSIAVDQPPVVSTCAGRHHLPTQTAILSSAAPW